MNRSCVAVIILVVAAAKIAIGADEKPIGPVEARKQVGQEVTIRMEVKAAKDRLEKRGEIYLDAEADFKDEKNFAVVITKQGTESLKKVGVTNPADHFKGKTIRARGTVKVVDGVPRIEVDDSKQIQIAEGNGQEKPPTAAEQYKALLKEHDRASSSGRPLTDAERLKFVGRAYKHRNALAQKFLELAEKHPNDPIALDALIQAVWQVNTTWPVELVGEDTARAKAFEIIQRDHIRSDKLGPLCQRVSYGFCKEYETFLRAVLANNPHKNIRATACLSLGHFLNNRLQRLELCQEQPELAKEFAGLFGKEYLAELQRHDRKTAIGEIEAIFDQATEKYGDVKFLGGETVAERAKAELFGIRNLSVGKHAPDIEGEDQDGKRFKLSDYRGKVVLLDFWSFV